MMFLRIVSNQKWLFLISVDRLLEPVLVNTFWHVCSACFSRTCSPAIRVHRQPLHQPSPQLTQADISHSRLTNPNLLNRSKCRSCRVAVPWSASGWTNSKMCRYCKETNMKIQRERKFWRHSSSRFQFLRGARWRSASSSSHIPLYSLI